MPTEDTTLDLYAPLSHYPVLRGDRKGLNVAPTWVPEDQRRRLVAYYVRQALADNAARHLHTGLTDRQRRQYREYGDGRLIVERYKAAVLGDGWALQVAGANDDVDDLPDLPDTPDDADLADVPESVRSRVQARRQQAYDDAVAAAVDAWEQALDAAPNLQARQADVDRWVDRQGIRLVVDEVEGDNATLADSVVILWPQVGDWPRAEVMDPGSYFPVGDVDDRGFYPKVHFAWEEEQTDSLGVKTTVLRRLTFELADLTALRSTVVDGARVWADPDGNPVEAAMLATTEQVDTDGVVTRLYPWDDDEGRAPRAGQPDQRRSRLTCLFSDGSWLMDGIGSDPDALDVSRATWAAYRHDLGVDFLPVVEGHNTPTGKYLWGRGILDGVAQVLDDLSETDTSTQSASRYLRDPLIHAPGVTATDQVAPGRILGGPEGSRMTVLDLSVGLEKLMAYDESLLGRVATNSRITAEALGRVDRGDLSGVALLLRLAPFAQVVGAARMVREPKWALFARMAQRMAQVQGVLPAGPTPDTRMAWGNFLPVDLATVAGWVGTAVKSRVMSTETAVRVLVAAGMPAGDAEAEVSRIRSDDAARAKDVADATGSEVLAAETLGLELPGPGAAPVVDLPPTS